jgi:HlyD family secretion protein
VQPGAAAFIENWGGAPLAARIERIEPVARTKVSALGIEEQRTNVILQFAEPPPPALRVHDFRIDARVIVAERSDVVRVPLGALFRDGNAWSVYVVRGGRAVRTRVEVGLEDERFREITRGLAAGETVVLFPSSEVHDGVKLKTLF